MKDKINKEAIDEIVKIIQDFQYNDELSEKYKREILDQDKIYDWQSIYIRDFLNTLFITINTFLLLSIEIFMQLKTNK